MTDPTADAAKLATCPFCGKDGDLGMTPDDYYLVRCRSCVTRGPQRGSEVEAITAWNTRLQPAPPEGEPDLALRVMQLICSNPDRFQTITGCDEIVSLVTRLTARTKVEDAEVAEAARWLRNGAVPHGTTMKIADLLERLAGYLSDMTADFKDQAAKLAELQEADVQRVKDIARLTIERDEAREKLAEREAELAKKISRVTICGESFTQLDVLGQKYTEVLRDIAMIEDTIATEFVNGFLPDWLFKRCKRNHAARQQQKDKP